MTLKPGQRTQVSLLSERDVPVTREYRITSHAFGRISEPQKLPVSVLLKLDNSAPGLGEPLPAGIVRVFGEGDRAQLHLLGEQQIGHIAASEEFELTLGNAFDVTGERTQTSYRKIDQNSAEIGWKIELRNARQEPVTVMLDERLPGDWRLLESSQPPQEREAQRLIWAVEVPAGGAQTLSYQVQARY